MRDIGPTEIILILAVVMLLFGAKKLPELARGSGRALRIFKAETKGLMDDDDTSVEVKPVAARQAEPETATDVPTDVAVTEQQPKPVD